MPKWYYTKKEIKENPSVVNGMDPAVESRYRREGARFIMELGTAMNLSLQSTMATAVVFFHRFYMKHTFQDFPRYPTGCACLFLAGKVEETPKKCRDMIDNAKKLLGDPKFSQQFGTDIRTQFEEVMTLERILLQSIKFDLQLEHPYKFLLKYAQSLKGDKQRLERMVQMAWNFVNDSLCTTLCLQWEPEIIAIALMYLACKLSKFEVHDWNGRLSEHLRWWDMYVEDMGIEVLEDICHQVLDFYSQVKSPENNSGSGTPTTSGSNRAELGASVNTSAKISPTPPQGSPGLPQIQQQQYPTRNAGAPVPVPPYAGHPPPPTALIPVPGQPPMPYGYPAPMGSHNPNHVGMMSMMHHRPMLPSHLQPPPPLPHGGHYTGIPPPPQHPGAPPPPPQPQQPQPPLPPAR